MPKERARIAAWDVRPPRSVTKPTTRSRGMRTASEGVSSSATRMIASPARSSIRRREFSSPPRCLFSARATSSMSTARFAKSSSGRLRKRAMRSAVVSETAHSAFTFSCAIRRSIGPRKVRSFRNRACAWKMPAYSDPRRSFTWRAVDSISSAAASEARRNRSISVSICSGSRVRFGEESCRETQRTARPTATPGETGMPVRERGRFTPIS